MHGTPGLLDGALKVPDWYVPFTSLQAIAEELRCSVMAAAEAEPEWRQMALLKLLAEGEARRRNDPGAPTA